jgi:putative ABC transport system ATP-binding protein
MLELDRVCKNYEGPGEVVRAVEDVTLTLAPSELVILLGPSGAGKTSLLLLAAGIIRPDSGTVRFEGRDLAAMTEREAARYRLRTLGFVFQASNLMPMSAVENVALPLIGAGIGVRDALREVRPLIEEVGLAHRADHHPQELSGGERQRVAIARALAARPKLVLADEPTGNLDSRRGAQILGLLRELSTERGTGVLVVTHDLRAARYADRAYAIEDGGLTEMTTDPDALIEALTEQSVSE